MDPLQPDPGLVRSAVEPSMLHDLPQEGDDALRAVLVRVRQVDLVAEQHHPLAELDGCHDRPVGRPAILAVVVKGLQQEFW